MIVLLSPSRKSHLTLALEHLHSFVVEQAVHHIIESIQRRFLSNKVIRLKALNLTHEIALVKNMHNRTA